jgi:hypothetical protein
MALVVNTNMNALIIENTLTNTNNAVSDSLQKLSSGLRINSAKDDPAGFSVANSFKAKIASMQVASQNLGPVNSDPNANTSPALPPGTIQACEPRPLAIERRQAFE